MTFQIRAIHLYSESGETRTLGFKTGRLNVITGASKTGKSSVLDIIDYCLASRRCAIPTGVIRDHVRMFALELETRQGVVITARRPPADNKKTTTNMYVGFHNPIAGPPQLAHLEPNSDINGAKAFLSTLSGIQENLTDPGTGTRERFSATIRHALYFIFQAQEEIANPELLFHSQSEQFVPQSIRDVLPYFLGVVDPEYVIKRSELRAAERQLRTLQRSQAEVPTLDQVTPRMAALVREAQSVGLLSDHAAPTDAQLAIQMLTTASTQDAELVDDSSDESVQQLEGLLNARAQLRSELSQVRAENSNLRNLLSAHFEFDDEVSEQRARLRSLELLRLPEGDSVANDRCPICDSRLADPSSSTLEILNQLRDVERDIEQVQHNVPGIQRVIADNEERLREINGRLRSNQEQIDSLTTAHELLRRTRDQAIQRALVRGRISLYLEGASGVIETSILGDEINSLIARIEVLRFEIDAEQVQARLDSAVSRISATLRGLAQQIHLEHSNSPMRLDAKNLTVVFDTPSGPRQLNQVGSGENWLGYHVSTVVAIHRFFLERNRPVPRFMVLDQPSQVYFPPDQRPGDEELADEDRTALSNLLGLVRDLVDDSDGRFQAIVMDHADLRAGWFQDAVVARWRDGDKLVPLDWISDDV